jgi:trehalose/maltose hydrolase-like predicted phosphorylase
VDIYNGLHWLNAEKSPVVENYHQLLDMYDGVLRTSYVWTQDNRRIGIRVEEFVSRDRADLAAVRVVITPEFLGNIQVRLPLHNWPPPRRYALARLDDIDAAAHKDPWLIWYPGYLETSDIRVESSPDSAVLSLLAHAPGAALQVGEAVAAEWNPGATATAHKDAEGASIDLTISAKPGSSYTITKFAALAAYTSALRPDQTATNNARAMQQQRWDALLAQHIAAWHRLWQTDILLDGNPELQRTIHSMLFYLLGSVHADLAFSTGPMGLSSAGYYGHIFWDADTFMCPPLLILHPDLARPMVAFRSRTRQAARANAKSNGFQGAMYPWEAGPDGAETTPRFAGQNAKYENHVNGDVALAAWQYWLATGDRQWLERDCWPILRDTADFWVSRVSYNAKLKRYEIGKVVSVDESLIGVNNDAWTNAIARKNLELAIAAAHAVNQQPNPKWQEIAKALYIPESDSPLLWFPLGLNFTPQQTRRAIEAGEGRVRSGEVGAMMGSEFYPIMAAESGDRQGIAQFIIPLSNGFLRPPFQVIAETPRNQNTNFITGAGAFLQQFVFGYSGLRLTENGLEHKFRPVLPPGVTKLSLKNVTVRGSRQTLTFTNTAQ